MDRHALGRRGEELAAAYLEGAGWSIVARNVRFGHKEVDLVVRRGPTLAFVEVKTRRGLGFGHPLEAITARKRREIVQVARHWLRHNRPGASTLRFDAVGVLLEGDGNARIVHVPNAWWADEV